jgi:serine/threonine protein kinase
MSPEQIRSSKNVDQRSDLWSLGVALFEMITGKLPFVADNVAGLLASVIADPPFTVSHFRPDVPPGLEVIVLACLEKDAARRIGSAGELARRLAPYATPGGAQLASRVQEVPSPSGSSPNVAQQARASVPAPVPSSPYAARAPSSPSSPSLPFGMPAPPVALVPPGHPSIPGPPVSFGTTGTDLSATGPAAFRASVRRSTARFLALAVGGPVALGALILVLYFTHTTTAAGTSASETEAGPPPSAFTPVPVSLSANATATTATGATGATSAASADSAGPAGSASATPPKNRRPKPGSGHGSPRGPAAGAPDLDSRF